MAQLPGSLDQLFVSYFPETVNSDVAFFHTESRSLIEADLLFNVKVDPDLA
jgi:hypothetical protein